VHLKTPLTSLPPSLPPPKLGKAANPTHSKLARRLNKYIHTQPPQANPFLPLASVLLPSRLPLVRTTTSTQSLSFQKTHTKTNIIYYLGKAIERLDCCCLPLGLGLGHRVQLVRDLKGGGGRGGGREGGKKGEKCVCLVAVILSCTKKEERWTYCGTSRI